MKVLHLSAVKNWGGGENHLENLCYELRNDVLNFIFCVKGSLLHERLKLRKEPVFAAPLANKMDPRYIRKLIQVCKKEHFDLIHIHDSTALTLAVMADHFTELPPFIMSKKTSFPIRPRRQTLYKYNYPKLREILCVSEATKAVSSMTLNGDKTLKVIYHGTRIDNKASETPFKLRDKCGIPSEKKIIGNIANHIEAKHLETFIQTADQLINKGKRTDFHFVQIGNFSKRTQGLKDLVARLQLQEHFSFLGYISEASNFIPQFDLMLITSESEGIPQAIYESFYHEVPVVSTAVGGIPEVIKHNENGLLSPAYDHENLTENILFLMENPQLITTFAKISREKLLNNFTTEIMARETLKRYKNVING